MEQHTQLLIKAEKKASFSKGLLIGFSLSAFLFSIFLLFLFYK